MITKLIDELNAIDDDEDSGWLNLSTATWEDENLHLLFTLKDLSKNTISSEWIVKCFDVLSYKIYDAYGGGINYHDDDHPAIRQYTDPHLKLHFNGKVESIA